jgi:carboxymethylenebutenolidase
MKPYTIFLFTFVFLLLSACSPAAPDNPSSLTPNTSDSITFSGMQLKYWEEHNDTTGYLVEPEGEGPFPAVILIHEWWGLNANIKELAHQFADEGYVALAVDMYAGESATSPDGARALATSVREDKDPAFENLSAALTHLEKAKNVDADRIASIGWCFGGGWSYEMAKNDLGVDASVIYYGRFNPEDDLSIMSSTIQGHFGEDDQSIPVDDVKAFQAKLKTASGDHEVFIYENAGHAFANSDSDAYQEESAEKAWERTISFLEEYL